VRQSTTPRAARPSREAALDADQFPALRSTEKKENPLCVGRVPPSPMSSPAVKAKPHFVPEIAKVVCSSAREIGSSRT